MKMILSLALLFSVVTRADVSPQLSAAPQWAGEWKGKNGCLVFATISESEVYKRRYLFRFVMFKNEEELRENNPQRDFFTHSFLADSVDEAVMKSVTARAKARCEKKGKCDEYWEGEDESSHLVPATAKLSFDKDLVLTGLKVDKGLGIPLVKKCQELQRVN